MKVERTVVVFAGDLWRRNFCFFFRDVGDTLILQIRQGCAGGTPGLEIDYSSTSVLCGDCVSILG